MSNNNEKQPFAIFEFLYQYVILPGYLLVLILTAITCFSIYINYNKAMEVMEFHSNNSQTDN